MRGALLYDCGDLREVDRLDEVRQRIVPGVNGEGPPNAWLMLVGEQPGNDEDLRGRPSVGPAGHLLRAIMAEANIPVSRVYITNAVKHFSFLLRGKRRLHKTLLQRAATTTCR